MQQVSCLAVEFPQVLATANGKKTVKLLCVFSPPGIFIVTVSLPLSHSVKLKSYVLPYQPTPNYLASGMPARPT